MDNHNSIHDEFQAFLTETQTQKKKKKPDLSLCLWNDLTQDQINATGILGCYSEQRLVCTLSSLS